jgi:uncharacterized protein (DUF1800 family)
MTASSNLTTAAIALNRFGLGARPDDPPPADPKAWLLAQFEHYEPKPAAWADQPDSIGLSSELEQQRMQLRQQRQRKPGDANTPSQSNAQGNQQPASESSVKKDKEVPRFGECASAQRIDHADAFH